MEPLIFKEKIAFHRETAARKINGKDMQEKGIPFPESP